MKVKLKLNPGDRGTKKPVAQYGAKLVGVRYRYDEERGRRLKTIELINEDIPWHQVPAKSSIVSVKTKISGKELHQKIRNAGGKWDRVKKVWKMTYGEAVNLGLGKRIVEE